MQDDSGRDQIAEMCDGFLDEQDVLRPDDRHDCVESEIRLHGEAYGVPRANEFAPRVEMALGGKDFGGYGRFLTMLA